jgi:hypothetical protein
MSSKTKRRRNRRKTPKKTATPVAVQIAASGDDTIAQRVLERLKGIGIISATNPATHENPDSKPVSIPTMLRPDADVQDIQEIMRETRIRAEQAQRHYLADAGKSGKPWFQNPKFEYQYSEFVLVTVKMAEELMRFNTNIRKLKPALAAAYARDIGNDRWLQTDESVTINVAGNMHDGQNRTEGIRISKKETVIYVTWNVPVEAMFVQDSGAKRTVNEKLGLVVGANMGNKLAALCRAMMGGVRHRIKYTESEIADFAMTHEAAIVWVTKNVAKERSDVQAVVAKAYLYYGEDAVNPFCDRLRDLQFDGKDDPACVLYRFLQRTKSQGGVSGLAVYKKTLSAIEKAIRGTTVRALYDRETDVFEWGEGWSVPPRG